LLNKSKFGRSSLFGHFFGTSAEFWLNLQKLYEFAPGRGKVRRSHQEPADMRRYAEKTRKDRRCNGMMVAIDLEACDPARNIWRTYSISGRQEQKDIT
jgi:hypothetical protein